MRHKSANVLTWLCFSCNACPRVIQIQVLTCLQWGPGKHSSSTTAKNYQTRLDKIVVSSLPKTFVDAIEISRALKIPYLWIDALCIIQPEDGDMEDWQREFPLMGKIYQNSVLTIAASGAKHKDE